jgi:hypothetical protein
MFHTAKISETYLKRFFKDVLLKELINTVALAGDSQRRAADRTEAVAKHGEDPGEEAEGGAGGAGTADRRQAGKLVGPHQIRRRRHVRLQGPGPVIHPLALLSFGPLE